jgi:tRNA(Ile)-lysidine synthase
MVPDQALVDRFRADLDTLIPSDEPVGLAVSGGPDSLALLLLAAAARPGGVEAASVDHGLRPEGTQEALAVAQICDRLKVPHAILTASWNDVPESAIQERARRKRYRLLSYWAEERRLAALVTAHHADDQAETFLMRLARGSGVRGLAAIRPRSITTGSHVRLVRPLLGWRRTELEQICTAVGATPACDPSNEDEQFERVRMRRALCTADWLDPAAIARSAAHLADADAALDWAVQLEWKSSVHEKGGVIGYRPADAPIEIMRRILAKAVRRLATEGEPELRGREIDQLLEVLKAGGVATIRGVRCDGSREWRFIQAPPRRDGPEETTWLRH